jgi:hypothetical protein
MKNLKKPNIYQVYQIEICVACRADLAQLPATTKDVLEQLLIKVSETPFRPT